VNLEGTIEKENAMKASSRRAKTGRRWATAQFPESV
jgi:hypothetical protein